MPKRTNVLRAAEYGRRLGHSAWKHTPTLPSEAFLFASLAITLIVATALAVHMRVPAVALRATPIGFGAPSNAGPTSERARAAAGDAAVLAVDAGHGGDAAIARTRRAAALRLDPYDGCFWSVVSALESKVGRGEAAA